jgi:hypothetical protein
MWWRVWVPTWRLFDRLGPGPQLYARQGGQWVPLLQHPPRPRWYSLFYNPQGCLFHARQNLLFRLVEEVQTTEHPRELVSFQLMEVLVRKLTGQDEFRITVEGQDVIVSGAK